MTMRDGSTPSERRVSIWVSAVGQVGARGASIAPGRAAGRGEALDVGLALLPQRHVPVRPGVGEHVDEDVLVGEGDPELVGPDGPRHRLHRGQQSGPYSDRIGSTMIETVLGPIAADQLG